MCQMADWSSSTIYRPVTKASAQIHYLLGVIPDRCQMKLSPHHLLEHYMLESFSIMLLLVVGKGIPSLLKGMIAPVGVSFV